MPFRAYIFLFRSIINDLQSQREKREKAKYFSFDILADEMKCNDKWLYKHHAHIQMTELYAKCKLFFVFVIQALISNNSITFYIFTKRRKKQQENN